MALSTRCWADLNDDSDSDWTPVVSKKKQTRLSVPLNFVAEESPPSESTGAPSEERKWDFSDCDLSDSDSEAEDSDEEPAAQPAEKAKRWADIESDDEEPAEKPVEKARRWADLESDDEEPPRPQPLRNEVRTRTFPWSKQPAPAVAPAATAAPAVAAPAVDGWTTVTKKKRR